jgi:hypothetical protein
MLGPVLERLEDELLDPMIDRVFQIAFDAGMLPPPPQELQENPDGMKVEYISILAQAQKAVSVGALERTAAFVGNLASVEAATGKPPAVLDKWDSEGALEAYANSIGLPPQALRTEEAVQALREKAAQEQQQAQALAMAEQAASTAATAAQVKTDEANLVNDVMDAVGLAQGKPVPNVGQR